MGIGFSFTCKACNYNKEIQIGVGLFVNKMGLKEYLEFNNQFKTIHKQTKAKLSRFLLDKDNRIIDPEYRAYQCDNCHKIFNKIYVEIFEEIDGKKNQIYHSEFKCWKCNSKLRELNVEDMSQTYCPKCSKNTFEKDHVIIQWD